MPLENEARRRAGRPGHSRGNQSMLQAEATKLLLEKNPVVVLPVDGGRKQANKLRTAIMKQLEEMGLDNIHTQIEKIKWNKHVLRLSLSPFDEGSEEL